MPARQLGIPFDVYYFNSQMEQPGKVIVDERSAAKLPRMSALMG